MIALTGSTRGGRAVAALGAQHLKRVHLELGGNSALVILDDVDLEEAASGGAWGSFFNQGQVCMTAGRHLVHERVAEEYVSRLSEHADRLPAGDPFREQVGLCPIIDAGQRDRIHGLVAASVDAGARLAAGGTYQGLVPADRPGRRSDLVTGLCRRGVRSGRAGRLVLVRGRAREAGRGL